MAYDIEQDPDVNAYDTDDLKDITKAGMGEAGREVVVNTDFIVALLLLLLILGLLALFIKEVRDVTELRSQ